MRGRGRRSQGEGSGAYVWQHIPKRIRYCTFIFFPFFYFIFYFLNCLPLRNQVGLDFLRPVEWTEIVSNCVQMHATLHDCAVSHSIQHNSKFVVFFFCFFNLDGKMKLSFYGRCYSQGVLFPLLVWRMLAILA